MEGPTEEHKRFFSVRRSNFPEENLYIEGGRVLMTPESHETKSNRSLASPNEENSRSQHGDKSAPTSIDLTPTPSYQFSEGYFSIDLAKSYSNGPEKFLVVDQGKKNNDSNEASETKDEIKSSSIKPEKHPFNKMMIEMEKGSSTKGSDGRRISNGNHSSSSGAISTKQAKSRPGKKLLCCYHANN